jgi:hypothetical protein
MDKLNKLNFIWDAKTRKGLAEQYSGLNNPPGSIATVQSSVHIAPQSKHESSKPLIFQNVSPRSNSKLKAPPAASARDDRLKSGVGQVMSPPPGQAIGHPTAVARTHLRPAIFEDHDDTPSVCVSERVAQLLGHTGDMSIARASLNHPLPIDSSILSQLRPRGSLSLSIPSQNALNMQGISGIPLNESLGVCQRLLDLQLSRSFPLASQFPLSDSALEQARARAVMINSLMDASPQPTPSAVARHPSILGNPVLPQQVLVESQVSSRNRSRDLLEQLVSQGLLSPTELQLLSLLPSEQQLEYATRILLEANLSQRGRIFLDNGRLSRNFS